MRSLSLALAVLALAPAAASAADGKIVFESSRDGDYELYAMDGDGGDVRRLTRAPEVDQQARWSPDGKRLAFVSRRSGPDDVYTMNADGSGITRQSFVQTPFSANRVPVWLPGGAQLLYTSNDGEGGNGTKIWQVGQQVAAIPDPALATDVSPAGTVVYSVSHGFVSDLWTSGPDGGGLTQLTSTPDVSEENAVWSPDGSRLAYAVYRAGMRWIEVANADGSGRVAVTDGTHWDHSPAWSPDGTRLLFNRDVGTTSQLFRVAASGGKPQQLTYGLEDWHNGNADWIAGDLPSSPAGKLRAFSPSTTGLHLKAEMRLSAPGRVTLVIRRAGKRVFRALLDAGDTRSDLWVTTLPAAGRYRVSATAGGRTITASVRAKAQPAGD
jgi:Tol biopolymer transport system component